MKWNMRSLREYESVGHVASSFEHPVLKGRVPEKTLIFMWVK